MPRGRPNIRSGNDRGVGFDLFVWHQSLPGARLARSSTGVRTCVLEEVIFEFLEKDKSSHAPRRGSCIEIPRPRVDLWDNSALIGNFEFFLFLEKILVG